MKLSLYNILNAFLLMTFVGACTQPPSAVREDNMQLLMSQKWAYHGDAINEIAKKLPLSGQEWNTVQETINRLEGASLEFGQDSTFIVRVASGQQAVGKWGLTEDGLGLTMQPSPAPTYPQQIEFISADSIYLAADKDFGFFFPKILKPFVEAEQGQ